MKFPLVRLDNRLLHGIILVHLAGRASAQRVMVIDDKTANDEFLKSAMLLAKPPGMAASVITLDTALTNMKAGKYEDQSILLIVRDPRVILALVENGIEIPALMVGGTDTAAGHKLGHCAYATDEELEVYKKISAAGVRVYMQYNPQYPEIEFDSLTF